MKKFLMPYSLTYPCIWLSTAASVFDAAATYPSGVIDFCDRFDNRLDDPNCGCVQSGLTWSTGWLSHPGPCPS